MAIWWTVTKEGERLAALSRDRAWAKEPICAIGTVVWRIKCDGFVAIGTQILCSSQSDLLDEAGELFVHLFALTTLTRCLMFCGVGAVATSTIDLCYNTSLKCRMAVSWKSNGKRYVMN
jgi:hypothetical protein